MTKPKDNTDLEPQISTICKYYEELDEEHRQVFFENMITHLLKQKVQRFENNMSGLITGQSGVKTFLVETTEKGCIDLLQKAAVKFIWNKNPDTGTYDFLFDAAELNNPVLDKLREISEDGELHIKETNEVP